MARINRLAFLQQLESVVPGLAPREIVEQSSCFVFKDGETITFNDEVLCRRKTDLKIEGAVQAEPLLKVLRKLAEEDLEINIGEGVLELKGKKREAGINMDAEILLPISKIEKPNKWSPLHEDFADAINITSQCAGRDESEFLATCVHIHPKFIEACDNYKMTRYKIKTGFKDRVLVRSSAVRSIVSLGMTKFSESESWLHFSNPAGLTLSLRRFTDTDEYPDLTPWLGVKGSLTVLPKGLGDALSRAEIFSAEKAENNQVTIELRPGKLRVTGEGSSGWYKEIKKLKYNGDPMMFKVAPELLNELIKRHNECEITKEALKVDTGKFVYVTSLEQDEPNGSKEEE
jgi:hypothetical protein